MPITASMLYRDSFNFFRNQVVGILLIALLTAFISVLLNQALRPDAEQLELLSATKNDLTATAGMGIQEIIKTMTPEQQIFFLKQSAAAIVSALVGNALLVGGVLTLIGMVSAGHTTSALRAMGSSLPQLPGLLLMLFISALLIQLGITLFIVPGLILAISFSLAPVIYFADRPGIFASLRLSCKLAFANARVIVPAMMLWLAAEFLVLFIISQSSLTREVAGIVLTALSNLISALYLIYLSRLYMLLRS